MPRREKVRDKAQKRQSSGSFAPQVNAPTSEEAVSRALNALHNLGNQRFVLSPFSELLDRWLVNLRGVLSEFESSSGIPVDDQFVKDRSQTISYIEFDLGKRRNKETSSGEAIKMLSDNRILLERIEEDYATAAKGIEVRKDTEIKLLSDSVNSIKEELDRIAGMKTGFFRGVSKEAKDQKEAEATKRLEAAQDELASAAQRFAVEREKLQVECKRRKQTVIEQISDLEKEIDGQEIDGSLEVRRVACEALVNAVNSFIQRKGLSQQYTASQGDLSPN